MAGRRIRRALARITVAALALATPAVLAAPSASAVPGGSSTVFINEFHYDNAGTDTGEFIEVAAPAGTDLSGWSIVRYNGSTPSLAVVYPTGTATALSGVVPNQLGGYGTVVVDFPTDGLQNGSNDGFALVNGSTVVQLLSYEGAFTASNGPAAGLTSTNLPVAQGGTTPAGSSLQLTGTGTTYADFTWTATEGSNTKGSPNAGQTFGASVDTAPSVASVSPQDGATQIPVDAVTVTFSEPVTVADGAFSLTCSVSGGVALAVAGGPTAYTLTPTSPLTDGDECLLSVTSADVADVDTNDPPNTMVEDFTSTFTVAATLISEIQGSGLTTSLAGQTVTVEAVVTAVQPGLSGYYLQEEDTDTDADPETSEGIFVFSPQTIDLVEVGDLVRLDGTVSDRPTTSNGVTSSQTQLSNVTVEGLATGVDLPTITPIEFPLASTSDLEWYEGMRVQLVDELVISEYFNYDRFGEVVLAKPLDGQDRLHTPTAVVEPGSEAIELAAEQALRIITLDDYNSSQNPATIPHPGNGQPFSIENTFRGGDTVTGVVGVIDHTFGLYRIQPTDYGDYEAVNERPADAPDVGGSIQVASFNVLNYFLTIDQGPDVCGPLLNQDCRGADSQEEFDRQRVKILEALEGLDADVVGLIEMENTSGVEPAADLVEGLNERMGPGTYDYIDTGVIGTDAIRLGFIYKPGTVTPIGDYAILDSTVDPRFIDTANRPMLTQTFEEVATHARVTVSVNHLKSKGSDCNALGDLDTGDGQGNCNGTRTLAAQAIADFLAGDPTDSGDPDHLVIGDLNSYDEEDPITALLDEGYTDLIEEFGGEFAYGYVFDGKVGYLDHALSNESLTPQVTGASEWHINADEPDILDYNLDFGRPSTFFEPNQYRSSDHDPVLVGLDLLGPADFVSDLRETLAGMDLQRGIANSLDAKLRSTLRSLEDGDKIEACESLQSFINQLNALTGKKISAEDAEILIAEAADIRRSLDC